MITEMEIRVILNEDKNKDEVCIGFMDGCFVGKELNHIKAAKAIMDKIKEENNE